MSEIQMGTGFAYCEHCRTLFLGLEARRFVHTCSGPRRLDFAGSSNAPHKVEHDLQYSSKVVDYRR